MGIIINKSGNTLESFSNKIGKDVIVEKILKNGYVVWQAEIDDTKVIKRNGSFFESIHVGIGRDEKEAVLNYTKLISGQRLVYKCNTKERQDWDVPILDYK